jgi:hypothetical protein
MKFALPTSEALRRSGRTRAVKTKDWPPVCPSGDCSAVKGCVCHLSAASQDRPAAHYLECAKIIYGEDAPGLPAPKTPPAVAERQSRVNSVFKARRRQSSPAKTTQQCRTIQKSGKKRSRARVAKAATELLFNADPEQTFEDVLGNATASELEVAIDGILEFVLPTPSSPEESSPRAAQESDPWQGVVCLTEAPKLDAFNVQWVFSQEEIEASLAPPKSETPVDTRTWDEILYCDEPPLEPEAEPEAEPVLATPARPVSCTVTQTVSVPPPPKTPPPATPLLGTPPNKSSAVSKQGMATLVPAPVSVWV